MSHPTPHAPTPRAVTSENHKALSGSHGRTLAAIFRHPSPHNLDWRDAVGLIRKIGEVDEKNHSEFAFRVGTESHLMRKPHEKDLSGGDVVELRHFLEKAGWSPSGNPAVAADSAVQNPVLLLVVDHHEARIYRIDASTDDGSMRQIKPYDPHHFRHQLAHKGQARERGERAPEDEHFYKQIAQALSSSVGNLAVVGHGTGKSNAAHHLADYLRSHSADIYQRIQREIVADFSSMTMPQLLELARDVPN